MKIFEQLPHTADIKIRVFGSTKKELFKHALIGMFQVIGPYAKGCTKEGDFLVCPNLPKKHAIDIDSPDTESLLVDFLSDALWFSDVYNEAYLSADIHELSDTHIKAAIYGVEVIGFDVVEMKAVTYHDLYIKQIDDIWQAEIVFDI
ncbi:MAG: archease [Candidatus Dependentiae bacterium]